MKIVQELETGKPAKGDGKKVWLTPKSRAWMVG